MEFAACSLKKMMTCVWPRIACYMLGFMGNLMLVLPMQQNGWALQLLSVACLSLAAKMEETVVPSLLDLQVTELKKLVTTVPPNMHALRPELIG